MIILLGQILRELLPESTIFQERIIREFERQYFNLYFVHMKLLKHLYCIDN
jgi:hypothetical protein